MKFCDKCGAPHGGLADDLDGCESPEDYKKVALHQWNLLAAISLEVGLGENQPFTKLLGLIRSRMGTGGKS